MMVFQYKVLISLFNMHRADQCCGRVARTVAVRLAARPGGRGGGAQTHGRGYKEYKIILSICTKLMIHYIS